MWQILIYDIYCAQIVFIMSSNQIFKKRCPSYQRKLIKRKVEAQCNAIKLDLSTESSLKLSKNFNDTNCNQPSTSKSNVLLEDNKNNNVSTIKMNDSTNNSGSHGSDELSNDNDYILGLNVDSDNHSDVEDFWMEKDQLFNDTDQHFTNMGGTHKVITDESSSDFLRRWALDNNVTHKSLTELLSWLSEKPHLNNLPKDARTLLNTPKSVTTKYMGTGCYYYFGLASGIVNRLKKYPDLKFTELHLNFNIDGLPLHKSSKKSFWPVLCKISNFSESELFPIAIFCGSSKPPLEEYLKDFVHELQDLLVNKLIFEGSQITIKVRSFCCDTPARAFVKNVKAHNAYFGCDKCIVKGEYQAHRMLFLSSEAERCDEDFIMQSNKAHHRGITPLLGLNVGMVTSFPIDYMHSVCLGVMRKLLFEWRDGSNLFRLKKQQIESLDIKIKAISSYWPREFNRKPRSLTELEHWKATEFRFYLLYLGPVLFIDILPKHVYCNFMLLKYGMTILLNETLNERYNEYANDLLHLFVKYAVRIYGQQFCVYNVHVLTHLAGEAKIYGSLNGISCFPFENYLYSLKKLLRKTNFPLQQVIHRIYESERYAGNNLRRNRKTTVTVSKQLNIITFDGEKELYNNLNFEKFSLSTSDGDNVFFCKEGGIFCIKEIAKSTSDNKIQISGIHLDVIGSFFDYPCDSRLFSMYEVRSWNENESHRLFDVEEIACKAIIMPSVILGKFIVTPFLHL